MGWQVRVARPADAPRIARLRVASWQHAYASLIDDGWLAAMNPAAAEAAWARHAETGRLHVAVDEADVPMAYSLVGEARQETDRRPGLRTGELYAIYADPAVLGTGAGHAVHEAGMTCLAGAGFEHAVLWVLEHNELGIHFYETQGWQPDSVHTELSIGGHQYTELRYSRQLTPRMITR